LITEKRCQHDLRNPLKLVDKFHIFVIPRKALTFSYTALSNYLKKLPTNTLKQLSRLSISELLSTHPFSKVQMSDALIVRVMVGSGIMNSIIAQSLR
jgi:hypothetical protein